MSQIEVKSKGKVPSKVESGGHSTDDSVDRDASPKRQ